ncbi:hypothetical protein GEMRC1_011518 [Eukaryota sp. GEM-RC1]
MTDETAASPLSDHESGWDDGDAPPDDQLVKSFLQHFCKHGRFFPKLSEALSLDEDKVKDIYRYVWRDLVKLCSSRLDIRPLHNYSTDLLKIYHKSLEENISTDATIDLIISKVEGLRPLSPRRRSNITNLPASSFPVMSPSETASTSRCLSWKFLTEHLPAESLLLLTTAIHYRTAPLDSHIMLTLRPISSGVSQAMVKANIPPRIDIKVPSSRLIRDVLHSLSQMWRLAIPQNADLFFRCQSVAMEFDAKSAGTIGNLFRSLAMPKNNFKLFYGFSVRQEPKVLLNVDNAEETFSKSKAKTSGGFLPIIQARKSNHFDPVTSPLSVTSPCRTPTSSVKPSCLSPVAFPSRDLFSPPHLMLQSNHQSDVASPVPKGQLSLSHFFQPIKQSSGDFKEDDLLLNSADSFVDYDYGCSANDFYSPITTRVDVTSPPRPIFTNQKTKEGDWKRSG